MYGKGYIDEIIRNLEKVSLGEKYTYLEETRERDYIIGRLKGMFGTLQNEDALHILFTLSKISVDDDGKEIYAGMLATSKTFESLGMTKKRYYTRLKKLKDERMITFDKKERRYFPTLLGIHCVKMVNEIGKINEK